jgi:hypothetical protein
MISSAEFFLHKRQNPQEKLARQGAQAPHSADGSSGWEENTKHGRESRAKALCKILTRGDKFCGGNKAPAHQSAHLLPVNTRRQKILIWTLFIFIYLFIYFLEIRRAGGPGEEGAF